MPFRLDEKYGEFRTKIQFTSAAWMPYQVYQACKATGVLSNTAYYQIAVCEKLARDLDLDLDELLANLPRRRTGAMHLFDPTGRDTKLPGDPPANGERNTVHTRIAVGRYGMGGSGDEEVY
jgi:hypothetical protein